MDKVKVGCVGTGNISGRYLGMSQNFPVVEMVAVADLDRDRAAEQAEKYNVPRVLSVEELINDPEVEIVLNLTIPKAHVPISMQALEAGKHTFCEKPLGVDRDQARPLLELARSKNLRVGCAPDTFLGSGFQTARKVIEDGGIGKPVAFTALMMGRGHETWHPSPEFYYQPGGGPMLDMGPYYLTALVNMLGPVKRIMGMDSIAIPKRVITSKPLHGKEINVEVPEHVCGIMEFESGVTGMIVQSFATAHAGGTGGSPIVVFGEKGTLRCGDPNQFDSPVTVRATTGEEWETVEPQFVTVYGRSLGLADMAVAIRTGRPHRCNLEQAFYVLDLMSGFHDSSVSGSQYTPEIGYERPKPMPADLPFGTLDE